MVIKSKQNYVFYAMLCAFAIFASLAHLNITFQVLLYSIIIVAPLLFDDTKTISVYLFSVCFMACLGGNGFLVALNVSLLLLELKKLILAIKHKEDLKNIKQIFIVWFSLLILLTLYSLIYNNFKVYRMGMFIDFVQCCIVCYLVRKTINIKHIIFTLFAGIVTSVAIASAFNIFEIPNEFVAGEIGSRFGGFFNNVNALSVYCSLCASCFIVLILTNKLKLQYYFYFPVIATCIGLLPYSKAFILVNILLYATWFVISFIKSTNKKRFILFSFVLVVILVLIAFIAQDYITTIMHRFTDTNHSSSIDNFTTGRAAIWEQYIDRWLKNPLTFLFGNGYTSPKIPSNQYEHSIYLAFLNQFGVIGTILIISTLIWTLRKDNKLQRCVVYYIPLVLFLINGSVSNLSGVLCTCLIWMIAFYFVMDNSLINHPNTNQAVNEPVNNIETVKNTEIVDETKNS